MEIFADTANIEEIKELISWGIISGVTTNPSIVAKEEGCDFEKQIKEIAKLTDGPISVEVTTNDTNEMVREAEEYNKWGKNIAIKIPMGIPGLKAVKILSEKGIKTNVTACMSTRQAVLAALAGATYVSLFWARIEDMGYDAEQVTMETVDIFEQHGITTKIILGSFRQASHLNRAFRSGAHVLTIPTPVLKTLPWNPRTESTIDEFLDTWAKFKKKK
ncbi:MAG: transaldolase family protein [archaeon]